MDILAQLYSVVDINVETHCMRLCFVNLFRRTAVRLYKIEIPIRIRKFTAEGQGLCKNE